MQIDPIVWRLHESVARQHHLFIELLPEPAKTYSALYYLYFRLIDSIEDSDLPFAQKNELLGAIAARKDEAADLVAKVSASDRTLPGPYRELALNWTSVRESFHRLPAEARNLVEKTGAFMAGRMLRFARQREETLHDTRPYFLRDFTDLDEYCHGVAGCVGELNVELFAEAGILDRQTARGCLAGAAELGRYLQIVNVIRDNAADRRERQKTHFPISLRHLPSSEQVFLMVEFAERKEDAIGAYLQAVVRTPVEAYSRTLFRVARTHLRHYRKHPEVFHEGSAPGALRLVAALPFTLKRKFIAHKLRKRKR